MELEIVQFLYQFTRENTDKIAIQILSNITKWLLKTSIKFEVTP